MIHKEVDASCELWAWLKGNRNGDKEMERLTGLAAVPFSLLIQSEVSLHRVWLQQKIFGVSNVLSSSKAYMFHSNQSKQD